MSRRRSLQESSCEGAEREAGIEDSASPTDLVTLVPGAKDEVDAREIGGLSDQLQSSHLGQGKVPQRSTP